jgi:copper chaperone NosL
MKALAGIAAAVLAVLVGVVFLWPAADVGPRPITFGRDTCARCRMHLSQPGFGGELRDHRGALTTYDDIGCLLLAMVAMRREVPGAWVEDHAGGGLVPLLSAVLVRGEQIVTPMGFGIVAFADADAARRFVAARGGRVLAVEELLRDAAELRPVSAAAPADQEEDP